MGYVTLPIAPHNAVAPIVLWYISPFESILKQVVPEIKSTSARNKSDESYVIDLCDEVLKQKAFRQHRFDFLKGDSGTKLPVDAYYSSLNLVIYKLHSYTSPDKIIYNPIKLSS